MFELRLLLLLLNIQHKTNFFSLKNVIILIYLL